MLRLEKPLDYTPAAPPQAAAQLTRKHVKLCFYVLVAGGNFSANQAAMLFLS